MGGRERGGQREEAAQDGLDVGGGRVPGAGRRVLGIDVGVRHEVGVAVLPVVVGWVLGGRLASERG